MSCDFKEIVKLKCCNENPRENHANKNHTINLCNVIPECLAILLESLVQNKALQFFLVLPKRLSFRYNFISEFYKLLLLILNIKLTRRPGSFCEKCRIKISLEAFSQLQGAWGF